MFKPIFLLFFMALSLFAANTEQCIHLLGRTSFNVDNLSLSKCIESKTYDLFVHAMIYDTQELDSNASLDFNTSIIRVQKNMPKANSEEKKIFRKELNQQNLALRVWWFEKMLSTEQPFQEKMLLFWHNHFTSSQQKVKQPKLMYDQNQLFRKYALGNFKELLHAIVRDPAMLLYLDNRNNNKTHPNENLARELLELFTMGEGHYSEKDIKELARGLTGYTLNKNFEFIFRKKLHDFENKTFLGQEGKFDADAMIDIILEHEATAVYIVTKLYKEFVSYTPNKQEILRLAKLFQENNYELKPLMFAMLTSNDFIDEKNRATMIKSPIELVVGTLRSLNYRSFDAKLGLKYTQKLSQNLLNPPNVKGWSGGKTWIDANTLLTRKEFLHKLTRGDEMMNMSFNQETLAQTLLPLKVYITPTNNKKEYLEMILQHPAYQLK